jgi:hypothetical protein
MQLCMYMRRDMYMRDCMYMQLDMYMHADMLCGAAGRGERGKGQGQARPWAETAVGAAVSAQGAEFGRYKPA